MLVSLLIANRLMLRPPHLRYNTESLQTLGRNSGGRLFENDCRPMWMLGLDKSA